VSLLQPKPALFFRVAGAGRPGPAYEHSRFVRGLLLGLAVSAILWAALAAVGYGAYLLIAAV
jgi:hypothetical protein